MDFTYDISPAAEAHWALCEKNHAPYIQLRQAGSTYCNIFYDITNLRGDLEEISEQVKRIYLSYVDFCLIPYSEIEHLLDQYYFFNLWVKIEHAEAIAQQLFLYLSART
ncbi:hypothetical protein ACSMEV_02475 [Pseudomonas sp. MLB6B]